MEIEQFCRDRAWKFCFIGGLAAIRWGRQRTTGDVYLSVLTGFEKEKPVIDEFLAHFKPRRPDASEFALRV
ncbi:MAG TPA: hypothetical protein VGJ15_01860, partial [Pirellulales bacterium]